MNKNLGKIFLLLVLWHVEILAQTYNWNAHADKTSAMQNEAIYLKYVCEFSDEAEYYAIDFHPAGEYEKYTLKLLRESQEIINNKRSNTYEYVAFVKEAGVFSFDFEIVMKKTSYESVVNTILGRDNTEKVEFTQTKIHPNSLVVNIQQNTTALVGSFAMQVKKDKPNIKAFEPYHMEIKITGAGNFDAIEPIKFEISGVQIFADKPVLNLTLTKEGYSGTWSQKFAFVSEKDFSIPQIAVNYYNIQEHAPQTMKAESIRLEVSEGYKKEELLDKEEPKEEFNYSYFYYFFTFLAGFLAAKIKIYHKTKPKSTEESFAKKVQNIQSLDIFLLALVMEDSKKYEELILQIETKQISSLREAKKRIKRL